MDYSFKYQNQNEEFAEMKHRKLKDKFIILSVLNTHVVRGKIHGQRITRSGSDYGR